MSDYRVIVQTCDKYLNCIKVFAHQFNKYWGKDQRVLVTGHSRPEFDLPHNFEFYSIGPQEEYPVGKWSNATIKLLRDIKDEVFVFMLDDYWLTGPQVDVLGIQLLVDYARSHPNVVRIDLSGERHDNMLKLGYDWHYGHLEHLELVKCKPGTQYHFSTTGSVWRGERILEFLQPNWSPWEFEIEGTRQLSLLGDNVLTLATIGSLIIYHGGIMPNPALGGDAGSKWLECNFFEHEDRKELEEMGILGLKEIGIPGLEMAR